MKKKQVEIEYNNLIRDIEKMQIYDGRDLVNKFVCSMCGNTIYTSYEDKGLAPFILQCPRCNGLMMHKNTFIRDTVPKEISVRKWYRPTLEDTLKMTKKMIRYILRGGLVLKE